MQTNFKGWHETNSLTLACLCSCFGVFFYLGYYVWWPFIFLATTPLALASESHRIGLMAGVASIATGATMALVYRFFAAYSLGGLLLVSSYHGLTMGCVLIATNTLRRWTKLPLVFIFPPLWTGGEYWRMMGEIGLPLGLLAPPTHTQLWMIQICDLGGLYLLSFAIAAISAALADVIRTKYGNPIQTETNLVTRLGYMGVITVWMCIAIYGRFRLDQAAQTMEAGPVVSVIQPDIPINSETGFGFDLNLMLGELIQFGNQSMQLKTKPDLIVWPEVPPGMPPLHPDFFKPPTGNSFHLETDDATEKDPLLHQGRQLHQTITNWVHQVNRPLLVGAIVHQAQPTNGERENEHKNAGLCFDPASQTFPNAQYKMRLFPIGEYLPWKDACFYPWLFALAPQLETRFAQLNISAGTKREIFELHRTEDNSNPQIWRYAISICNEIMFPRDAGVFLAARSNRKPIDFVVNMSNNGGFQRNHASIFHSLLLPFRAVEARVGIARSSNTGISGFVKPTGEIHGEVVNGKGQRWTGVGAPELTLIGEIIRLRRDHEDELTTNLPLRNQIQNMINKVKQIRSKAGISGQSTQTVWIDQRRTFYSQSNDTFAKILCYFLWVGCLAFVTLSLNRKLRCLISSSKF